MRAPLLFFVFSAFLVGCGDDARNRDIRSCPTAPSDGASARIFAIQPKISPEHYVSHAAYQNHLVELARTQVAPCLAKDRPNIIVFPENTGLTAAFIGSRGQGARESTSVFGAFLSLGGNYVGPIDFYKTKWPDIPLPNQIELGTTDTVWRAFFETNQLIAQELGAWVISSTNVSGLVEKSTDSAEIAALADPDLPNPAYVYVARDPAVYNTTYVHGPDGSIIAARKKPYLVSTEKSDLTLTSGPLREAVPIETGSLGLGIFISKDAWMPDMVDRLSALGADTFVQPEAFSGWTIPESPGEDAWAPDILSQSAPAAVRKHGSFRQGIVAHLTGNLLDLTFDGQSIIVGDPKPENRKTAYVGQPEDGGVLAVAPWVTADPVVEDATATLEARRASLRMTGQTLLPGATRANQYVETAIGADVGSPLPTEASGAPGLLGAGRALSSTGKLEQSRPAAAWSGSSALIVGFQEGARGATRIMVASSEDQGKTFDTPHNVTTGSSVQITPAVAVSGTYVYAAWQERDKFGARIACALSNDRGKTFGPPTFLPSEGAIPDAWFPTFATSNGQVYLAYVDGSSGNERIFVARAAEGSLGFVTNPVEAVKPHAAADVRNNQWSPAIAASMNQVAVAWVDYRNDNWDVFLSRSLDGGTTFPAAIRLNDGGDVPERLNDDPFLLFLPNVDPSTLAVGWTDVRQRIRHSSARMSLVAGAVIGQSRVFGVPDTSAMVPRLAPLGPSKFAMVWQDDRALNQDVYLAVSADGGATFGSEQRIDDGGNGASYQTAPAVAADGQGSLFVAWEDTRSGQRRIRFVLGKP